MEIDACTHAVRRVRWCSLEFAIFVAIRRSRKTVEFCLRLSAHPCSANVHFPCGVFPTFPRESGFRAVCFSVFRGDETQEQFNAFIMEELMSLKNGLALATQAREQSDDEIIQVWKNT